MSCEAEKQSKPEDGGEEREEEKAVDNELCQGKKKKTMTLCLTLRIMALVV